MGKIKDFFKSIFINEFTIDNDIYIHKLKYYQKMYDNYQEIISKDEEIKDGFRKKGMILLSESLSMGNKEYIVFDNKKFGKINFTFNEALTFLNIE